MGSEAEAPEMSEEEKELLRVQTEASKLMIDLSKENMAVNRMLFPHAAAAIGFDVQYSQPQANKVFRPPTSAEKASIEDRDKGFDEVLTGSEEPGDQGPISPISAGLIRGGSRPIEKSVGGGQMSAIQTMNSSGPGSEPMDSQEQQQQGQPRENTAADIGGDFAFSNITGIEQVGRPDLFQNVPGMEQFSSITGQLGDIGIPSVRGGQTRTFGEPAPDDPGATRRSSGREAEESFRKNRERIAKRLKEELSSSEIDILRRALRG